MTKNRTAHHYIDMLTSNPNTTIGFTFAAQAVYAAKHGMFNTADESHDDEQYRTIARRLKQKYGENLSVDEVRAEMATINNPVAIMSVRDVPEQLRLAVRAKALQEGKTMQQIIIQLMQGYINRP